MISSAIALKFVRHELRTRVLPSLDEDGQAHSVLVAAIGVLGEVISRVRDDDTWCEASVQRLTMAAASWPQRLQALPEAAAAVTELVDRSRTANSLSDQRMMLLEAAEVALVDLWAARAPGSELETLRTELRELLAADTEIELERRGRK